MGPRISIGMPCYNSERWISPAIESLLGQTFEDFELIVSDNASSDGTWDIVQRYAASDDRIRPYRNPENLGASANFNRVFELARGPYFKWASSNDWCAPGLLDACHDALDAITHCLDTPRRVHAVLLNRDWHADLASLEHLAARPPEFIGMMGSRKRIAEVLAHLPATWTHLRNHLTAPVGLDLGAETPEEIAVSILAQLIAFSSAAHDPLKNRT